VTPETVDYMCPARVVLAGIDYKIFVCNMRICGSDNKCIESWSENFKERDIFRDLGIDGMILLKCILCRMESWLNIETSDELL